MKFKVKTFTVKRLNAAGFWAIETKENFDLGMLFLRVQEFYESSNPSIRGNAFRLIDYMRWYSLNISEEGSFTYTSDWKGFNVPSTVIHKFQNTPWLEAPTPFDTMFANIVQEIKKLQAGPFYLIGTIKGDTSTLAHETSHAMWMLLPGYKEEALELLSAIPKKEVNAMRKTLHKIGYAKEVLDDEIVAYLSTGLRGGLEGFAHLRPPFVKHFNRAKKTFC